MNLGVAVGEIIWDLFGKEKRLKVGGRDGRWCKVSDVLFRYFVSY